MKDVILFAVTTLTILALGLIAARVKRAGMDHPPRTYRPLVDARPPADHNTLVRAVRIQLAEKLDWKAITSRPPDQALADLRHVIEHLIDVQNPLLNRIDREAAIAEVLDGIKLSTAE